MLPALEIEPPTLGSVHYVFLFIRALENTSTKHDKLNSLAIFSEIELCVTEEERGQWWQNLVVLLSYDKLSFAVLRVSYITNILRLLRESRDTSPQFIFLSYNIHNGYSIQKICKLIATLQIFPMTKIMILYLSKFTNVSRKSQQITLFPIQFCVYN